MASYLVTGASRGIGLELVRQLLELPASQVGKVVAGTRGSPPAQLQSLLEKHGNRLVLVTVAIDNSDSVRQVADEVGKIQGEGGLDVLVNNAGISEFSPGGIKSVQPDLLAHMLDVLVVGPHRMTAAFLPLLEAGKQKKIINLSSSLGSVSWIEKFKAAPSHTYKIGKAALHMLNAQYAMDFAETDFTFLCVSPGWLKTDLGGEIADLEVDVGVAELKRIILDSNKAQSGKLLNIHVPGYEQAHGQYDGKEIPW